MLTREQIAFFIYRFRKFDVTKREQRQRLIDSFVNAVYLYEDKIILTFNYKDGSKTITLAEVEGSDLSVSWYYTIFSNGNFSLNRISILR